MSTTRNIDSDKTSVQASAVLLPQYLANNF